MPILTERTWLYKGQTGRVFAEGAEVPDGWSLSPEVPYAAEGEWPEVVELYHTPKAPAPVAGDEVRRGPGRPPNPRPTDEA